MVNEEEFRTHGFIRPTKETRAAFAKIKKCRAQLFAPDAALSAEQRIALRADIGKLSQQIRLKHLQGGQK